VPNTVSVHIGTMKTSAGCAWLKKYIDEYVAVRDRM